jgi:hypothetical protein
MALVATSLLALAQGLPRFFLFVNGPYSVVHSTHAFTLLEIGDRLVDGGLVVADNTNSMQAGKVAEIPLQDHPVSAKLLQVLSTAGE